MNSSKLTAERYMSEETVKSIADAMTASAEFGKTALETSKSFGALFNGVVSEYAGTIEDRLKIKRWKQRVEMITNAYHYLQERGLQSATRDIPMPFAVKLLENGELEDNSDLQDIWARLLANAADASSRTEPRISYIEILSRMTELDARNLEQLVKTTIRHSSKMQPMPFVSTFSLPESSSSRVELGGHSRPIVEKGVALSVSNMIALGLLGSATGTFDGSIPVYEWVSVTPLGIAFYWACSKQPQDSEGQAIS